MPYYGQNGFYLPFKNNANTTALGFDYSGNTYARYNATAVGDAKISTARSKFGGASAYFDGINDIITVPDNPGFAFGSGNFTIEFWVYANGNLAGVRQFLIYQGNNAGLATTVPFQIELNTAGKIKADVFSGSTGYTIISGSNFGYDTFRHVALVRNGNTLSLYVDGSSVGSVSVTGVSLNDSSDLLKIGDYSTANASPLLGYIDDLRIYKGIAKYTANFTPPTAALPLGKADPNWQYCSLAMPMDGTEDSTVFPVYAPFNWTPNNFSVTAGAGNDSLIDVPTRYADGGNNRGNYCVWNPLDKGSNVTLSDGNLSGAFTTAPDCVRSTFAIPQSGKWYWEILVGAIGSGGNIGIASGNTSLSAGGAITGVLYQYSGYKSINSWSNNGSYGSAYTTNDVIGVAADADNGEISFYKNGSSLGVAQSSLNMATTTYFPFSQGTSATFIANFGQRSFAHTPPTGFKALNSYNLNVQGNLPQLSVEYLVVAGGGGGGGNSGAGSGAGGYRSSVVGEMSGGGASAETRFSAYTGGSYSVSVGAGGVTSSSGVAATSGINSKFATIESLGGTGAASSAGGSGRGGASGSGAGTAGTTNQGYAGGTGGSSSGGGGGGAGGAGGNGSGGTGGNGGVGVASSITGASIFRAGGGGAGGLSVAGAGGNGGGGNGLAGNATSPASGVQNTGGGAGSGYQNFPNPGNGGSGVVILRFPSTYNITVSAGLTYSQTTVSGNKIVQFTAGTGTVTFS